MTSKIFTPKLHKWGMVKEKTDRGSQFVNGPLFPDHKGYSRPTNQFTNPLKLTKGK